jgi:hypothetical protein
MDASSSATVSSYTKIKVPDFTAMLKKSLWDAITGAWDKLPIRHSPYFVPAIIGIGVVLVLLLIFWLYVNFIR